MKSLPWVIAAAAIVAGVVGANKIRQSAAPSLQETTPRLLAAAASDVEKKRPVEALRKLRGVPTSDRQTHRAREIEGMALAALYFASQAEAKWLDAIRLQASLEDAPFRLFDLYFISGRHAEARKLAVELAPKQESPSYAAAMLLETIRQEHERAATPLCLEYYEPVLIREPENPYAIRTVGRCFVELGRVTEGLHFLKVATEKLPNDAETWAIRLESLNDAGRSSQAVSAYQSAPDGVKRHVRVLRAAATALDSTGDAKSAEACLQEALKIDAYDRKVRTQLATLLQRRGAGTEAKQHEQRAREIDDIREKQAELLQQARRQKNDPSPDLCRQLGQVCRDLGWNDVGGQFEKLAERQSARPMGTVSR